MERHSIEADIRTETGKGAARRLRREGRIPGVVYGREKKPESIAIDPGLISKLMHSNSIFDLTLKGDEEKEEVVIIKDYQKDVIKGTLTHVDFQFISMDEKISVSVPLRLLGTAAGVHEGGVLQQLMREVDIEALPTNIPSEIELDISELEMANSLSVADLETPEGVEITTDSNEVIVTVVPPTEEITEEEEEDIFADEFEEPEVIGEESDEEEEEDFEREEE